MSASLDLSAVRRGRVNGRYFRENFAQGGIDLVQIIPELVTNADSAIALGGRPAGRIVLRFGPPDPAFVTRWKPSMRLGAIAQRRTADRSITPAISQTVLP